MCRRQLRVIATRGVCAMVAVTFAVSGTPRPAPGQERVVPTAPSPTASYRPPAIALVQPSGGASVPQDRPIVVLRFAAGDSTDPVDARSLTASVDGKDRSALFHVARDEAWGPLAPEPNDRQLAIAPGAHQLSARICSVRGACAEISATVMVATSAALPTEKAIGDRKRTLLDLLLAAARKLLNP